jgi:hypothetical protein
VCSSDLDTPAVDQGGDGRDRCPRKVVGGTGKSAGSLQNGVELSAVGCWLSAVQSCQLPTLTASISRSGSSTPSTLTRSCRSRTGKPSTYPRCRGSSRPAGAMAPPAWSRGRCGGRPRPSCPAHLRREPYPVWMTALMVSPCDRRIAASGVARSVQVPEAGAVSCFPVHAYPTMKRVQEISTAAKNT